MFKGNLQRTVCFSWSETRSACVGSFNQAGMTRNMHVRCSAFSGWASNLIANLDPTTLLFEDDEDYDYPGRCALRSLENFCAFVHVLIRRR